MKVYKLIALSLALFLLAGCGAAAPAEIATNDSTTNQSTEATEGYPEPDKLIALTFDDGPSSTTMAAVLDLLKEYDAIATFFIVGKKIKASTKDVLQRAVDEGHELANHSFNHVRMAELTEEEIVKEYENCQKAVLDAVGVEMYYFRAPFGSVDERVRRLVPAPFMLCGAAAGDGTNESLAEDRAYKVISKSYHGCIVLLHCFEGNEPTVEALKTILPELKKQGYKFVTLTQLYEESGTPIPVPDTERSYYDINRVE